MLEQYNDEYNWMLKNKTGYHPWAELHQSVFADFIHCMAACNPSLMPPVTPFEITQRVVRFPIQSHPLLDIFFKSLIRAEIRLISRYIPQRSNEERLTGHFVSEIDNSVNMLKDTFLKLSKSLYGEEKMIDFFYMDLSKGGKIEKTSGADLGFILVVDLPDFPFLVKSILFQAKKINGNGTARIDKNQLDTMKSHGQSDSAYLFYDMNLNELSSPIVDTTKSEIFNNESGNTFSIKRKDILENGTPFSLFVMDILRGDEFGIKHEDFDTAYKVLIETMKEIGKLGVVSLGKPIKFSLLHKENEKGKESDTENNEEPETENMIKLSI
jgi:hypothetical protein